MFYYRDAVQKGRPSPLPRLRQKPRFQEKCAMKDLPHEKQKLLDDSLGVATHAWS
jgi:hypothetical protein